MIFQGSSANRPRALRAQIDAVERRIYQRHGSIGATLGSLSTGIRRQIVTPGTVITAGVLGALLHRSHLLQGTRLLPLITAANSGLRLLLMARANKRNSSG